MTEEFLYVSNENNHIIIINIYSQLILMLFLSDKEKYAHIRRQHHINLFMYVIFILQIFVENLMMGISYMLQIQHTCIVYHICIHTREEKFFLKDIVLERVESSFIRAYNKIGNALKPNYIYPSRFIFPLNYSLFFISLKNLFIVQIFQQQIFGMSQNNFHPTQDLIFFEIRLILQ